MAQAEKIFNQTNQNSIKTRYRYLAAEERFAEFLAEKYRLQKLSNVKARHFISYVEYLQEKGASPSTIKTDSAGIRFFHDKTGSRNRLPDNSQLKIEKRQIGKLDRAWSPLEIQQAINLARTMGREDVAWGIRMAVTYGMRIEEVCRCQVSHLKDAIENGDLYIRGKNGQIRYLRISSAEQIKLTKELITFAKSQNRWGSDRVLYDNITGATQRTKKSIENWIANHRSKFQDTSRAADEKLKKLEARAMKQGLKLKVDTLTFHGLRHTFAQNQYTLYSKKGMPAKTARLMVSEQLGHHRDAVTKIYLSGDA